MTSHLPLGRVRTRNGFQALVPSTSSWRLALAFALAILAASTSAAAAKTRAGYTVTVLQVPGAIDIQQIGVQSELPSSPVKPVTMDKFGDVAAVIQGPTSAERLPIVWDHSAHPKLYHPPSKTLSRVFQRFGTDRTARTHLSIEHIATYGPGTVYATVSLPFDGAYSGVAVEIFRLGDAVEHPLTQYGFKVAAPDHQLVCVDNDGQIGVSSDHSRDLFGVDPSDTSRFAPEAGYIRGDTYTSLDYGVLTSLSGSYAVGYLGYNLEGKPYADNVNEGGDRWAAIFWDHGKRRTLGAGMPLAVNALGVAVGDDRATIQGQGHPVLWRNGRLSLLSDKPGRAESVNDAGTIVGVLTSGSRPFGFVYRDGRLQPLDSLLVASGWHISDAYVVNRRGSIAALGEHAGKRFLVRLDDTGIAAL